MFTGHGFSVPATHEIEMTNYMTSTWNELPQEVVIGLASTIFTDTWIGKFQRDKGQMN